MKDPRCFLIGQPKVYGPCSNSEGLARVWDSDGVGACAAHANELAMNWEDRRRKGATS